MTRSLCLAVLLLASAGFAVAQDGFSVQVQNHLEASHDIETEKDIVEDWLDVDAFGEFYTFGLRYSAFVPPRFVVSTDGKSSEGITHRFAELRHENLMLRVGTFTRLFGRGLSFRSFENRDLRVDTNIDGFLFDYGGDWLQAAVFNGRTESGQMETGVRERDDRFTGADLALSHGHLTFGGSFLQYNWIDTEARPEVHAVRASIQDGPLALDWEGARHLRPGEEEKGLGQVGEASYLLGPFTFYGGYKYYREMAVYTHDQKLMNQPPVLLHDHRATLLNRHPHQLDPNDEKGYLLDLSFTSWLGSITGSHAETDPIAGKLGESSYRDSFLEWDRNNFLGFIEHAHLILNKQKAPYLASHPEYPLDTYYDWEDFYTVVADVRLPLPVGSMLLLWEHQHKKSDHVGEYDDDLISVEYETPGGKTFSFIGEYVNWSPLQQGIELQQEERSLWYGGLFSAPIGNHHLRVFAGSRRAGYICIGGVCRYEPEFEGIEIMLVSRF